jgi:hypothetical protein
LGFAPERGLDAAVDAGLGFGMAFGLTVAMIYGGNAYLLHYVVRYGWYARESLPGGTAGSWRQWLSDCCYSVAATPTCSSIGCCETTTLATPRDAVMASQ